MKRFMILLICASGCAGSAVPPVRFANAPVPSIVDDRRDVKTQPEERVFLPNLYFFDASVRLPITRAFELRAHHRAQGVNALDEAPDSTWFTNRISARVLTAEEVGNGPVTHDPEPHKPWIIQSTKIGGTTAGFIVKDQAGVKYLLKFDKEGDPPEMETGTHVICNRFMWATGYNVAEDQILYIRREDLKIAKDAKKKDNLGKTTGVLEESDVDKIFKDVRKESDGRIRTLVSRWIDGKPIGGYPNEGVREDDPNDRIAHEDRRDLRGLLMVDAWLDAVDVTEGQFVDAYVEDPVYKDVHYVKHYAIDFGKSLGAMGAIDFDWWRGHTYRIDFPMLFKSLFTIGLNDHWWEHRQGPTTMPAVSRLFDVDSLEPDNFHPDSPGFVAFLEADRFDKFWGAKLVARLTPEQIRAGVAAAKLTDPKAAEYLVTTLIARQHKLAAYWFERVNPLDRFSIGDTGGVCFDDLAIDSGLAMGNASSYVLTSYDWHGHAVGAPIAAAASGGNAKDPVAGKGGTCSAPIALGSDHDGYTIVRVDTRRDHYAGTTYVHVAQDPATKRARVIGIWRP